MKFDKYFYIALFGAFSIGWGIGTFMKTGSLYPAFLEMTVGAALAIYGYSKTQNKVIG